jgi:hypothetical protein
MSFVLGEWRAGKVRPIPGNTPHGRPVSRVISCPLWEHLRRFLRHHSIPADSKNIPGPRYAFSRHGGIFHTDVA